MLEKSDTVDDGVESPVTTIIARRIKLGFEAKYEDWVHRIIGVSSQQAGHQSVDVIRPAAGTNGVYLVLVRFDNRAHQQAWEHSKERAQFLLELEDYTEGDTQFEKLTGLETWFTLPGEAPLPPPNKHKMALIIAVAVFVLVLLANLLFGDWLAQLPLVPRVALLAIVQVALLSYVIMPRATVLLKRWLYPPL